MSRLPRPSTPLDVKLRVLLRQLGDLWPDEVIAHARELRCLGTMVNAKKTALAAMLGCEVKDLWLDHTLALENRPKMVELANGRHEHVTVVPPGAKVLCYFPAANDPEYLQYRPHGAQFAGSHDVKTRVRGDHGQLSDNALAKKERRRQRKLDPKRRRAKIANRKRPWPKGRKIQNRRMR